MPVQQHKSEAITSPLTTPIEIDRVVIQGLRPEAARRQTTVPDIINRLLAVTVGDRLVQAVLDDEAPSRPTVRYRAPRAAK